MSLIHYAWIVISLLGATDAQRAMPRCASLCAMNSVFGAGCFISDILCLCNSAVTPKSFAKCVSYSCSESDRAETKEVLATLCGRALHLEQRDRTVPSTTSVATLPTTLTMTSILPPAGNKTQSVTYVYTTVVELSSLQSSLTTALGSSSLAGAHSGTSGPTSAETTTTSLPTSTATSDASSIFSNSHLTFIILFITIVVTHCIQ